MKFTEQNNEIVFSCESDLKEVVYFLQNFRFADSDNSNVHEIFSIYIYLVGLYKMAILKYPFKILKQEHPDFIVNSEIGIEHSQSTIGQYKIAYKELKKHPKGSSIELPFYSPFNPLSNKEADVGIIQPGQSLKSEGWTGYEVEEQWSEIILKTIKEKVSLLNKNHFLKQNQNELFIEDDSPIDWIKDENKAIEILKQKYETTNFNCPIMFNKIHIFSNENLIFDIFGKCTILNMKKKELPEIS